MEHTAYINEDNSNSPPVTFAIVADDSDNNPFPTDLNDNNRFTPDIAASYHNSPFSANSDLSFEDEFDSNSRFSLLPGYDPSEYDNPAAGSLLMFNDNDYLSSYDPNSQSMQQQAYGDYSSPGSSNGGPDSANDGMRSRASSVSSNHQQSHLSPHMQAQHLTPSPRMSVAQSFEGMSFHSPAWSNEPLPDHRSTAGPSRSLSPQRAQPKPQSPPRLLMPDDEVPTINAPDAEGGAGPALRIVPATPVSGGGAVTNDGAGGGEERNLPFRNGNTLAPFNSWSPHHSPSPHPPDSDASMDQQSNSYRTNFGNNSNPNLSSQSQAGPSRLNANNSFLFPNPGMPRTRSKSDGSLEPPAWDTTAFDDPSNSAIMDDSAMNMTDVSPPNSSNSNAGRLNTQFSFGGSPTSPSNSANNGFLTVEATGALRRSKSDSYNRHVRGSRSEDLRFGGMPGMNDPQAQQGQMGGNGLLFPPSAHGDFIQQQQQQQRGQTPQFLSPRPHGHSYSYSGSEQMLGSGLPNLGAGMGLGYSSSALGLDVGVGMDSGRRSAFGHGQGQGQGHFRRTSSGSRSERGVSVGRGWMDGPGDMGGEGGGSAAGSIGGSVRASPYPSPNVSPRVRYDELPPTGPDGDGGLDFGLLSGTTPGSAYSNQHSRAGSGSGTPGMGVPTLPPHLGLGSYPQGGHMGMGRGMMPTGANNKPAPSIVTVGGSSVPLVVSKQNVTTARTSKASHNRRKQEATFVCPVPGCGSTFTRSFNLKGHIRSHNEEKPFLCHWPGCNKGFARQHDCKRHEQLHTNYRPFTCEGCQKPFARMDALNRHLRSEGGAECQRTLEQNGTLPAGLTSPPSSKSTPTSNSNSSKSAPGSSEGNGRGRASSGSGAAGGRNDVRDSEPARSLPIPIMSGGGGGLKMEEGGNGPMGWPGKMEEAWSVGVTL